ncbi:MAG: limonene-1,2-epoxide hydrolase family protein [Vicinamibacterales bacterium]
MTTIDTTRRTLLFGGGMALAGAFAPSLSAAARTEKDWTAAEKANVKVVNDFIKALEDKNGAGLVAAFAPTGRTRMTAHTQVPAVPPEQFRKAMEDGLFKTGGVQFKTLETHAQGPLVTNVRIDRITSPKGQQDLYYMGVFFLKDGKIVEWNDYEIAPATPVKPGQPL